MLEILISMSLTIASETMLGTQEQSVHGGGQSIKIPTGKHDLQIGSLPGLSDSFVRALKL